MDEEGGQSLPATVIINFESIDNPPVLDLNGPQEAGRDYTATYLEGNDSTPVYNHATCIIIYRGI